MNPDIKFKTLKDGPHHMLTVEISEEIWNALKHANLTGHVAEIEWRVVHTHGPKVFDEPKAEPAPKTPLGPFCKGSVRFCQDQDFWAFLSSLDVVNENNSVSKRLVSNEREAGGYLKKICGVSSRKELDTNDEAAVIYKDLLSNFSIWKQGRRQVAR